MEYKQHIKSLDGIRGIAVLLVMLYHFKAPGLSLGFIGVPIFFCLSGFLITNILLNDRNKPLPEYLKKFFYNRSLRIFPLFYLYLIANYVYILSVDGSGKGYGWFILYLQNYYLGAGGSLPGILGHTWSLAIEEQFYWFWPFILFFIKDQKLLRIFIPLVFISLISRYVIFYIIGAKYMINATLLSCADMMVMGAIFAQLKNHKKSTNIAWVVLFIGLIVTLLSVLTMPMSAFWDSRNWASQRWWLYTALGFLFSSIIFLCYKHEISGRTNILLKFFKNPFLVYTGKISYGLYMWHTLCYILLIMFSQKHDILRHNSNLIMPSLIISYVVATISFYFFELKFLKLKR
ncbi:MULTISPECIES: acyltransferase [Enterobacter]|uniref:acyltransferase family protein n=1 Tax=Enterobacter TaxID=547 RepID=UPI00077BFE25|nr:acyltransferase [Enterobacter pseudoroggenkampii]WJW87057.1 acyltransferase [Enterobacter pseudoroggenkampii]